MTAKCDPPPPPSEGALMHRRPRLADAVGGSVHLYERHDHKDNNKECVSVLPRRRPVDLRLLRQRCLHRQEAAAAPAAEKHGQLLQLI